MANQKVRRPGIAEALFRKLPPFRKWLNEQKRLPWMKKASPEKGDEGWTVEEFCEEARKRGIDRVRVMTVYKWSRGTVPRNIVQPQFLDAFKKEAIRFQ